MFACPATDDFFRARIDQMIELRHPLAMQHLDLYGEMQQRQSSSSNAGRPRVPLRTMISLLYLKHAFNESDEGVVEGWGQTPTWQFFAD